MSAAIFHYASISMPLVMVNTRNPLLDHILHPVSDGAAFFLSKARHDGDEQFLFGIDCPDVFLLKIDFRVVLLQLPDDGKAVHRVSGKSAYALGDDQVDFPGQSVRHHRPRKAFVSRRFAE